MLLVLKSKSQRPGKVALYCSDGWPYRYRTFPHRVSTQRQSPIHLNVKTLPNPIPNSNPDPNTNPKLSLTS